MVFKDADEAAIQWQAKTKVYTKTESLIVSIIHQSNHVINTKEHSLSYKVGYLEGCLETIKDIIENPENYQE
jgi:hypothetical protein